MNLFRQLAIFFLAYINEILVNGRSIEESHYNITYRYKRSTSCSSVYSLKKYLYTTDHTACISPSASANQATAGVTDAEKTEIVNVHNNYRASTQATDMTTMSWDVEVAFLAQKWAENCEFGHDQGYKRRIPGRFSLGQNLALSSSKMTWTAAIKLWYDEIVDFTYNGNNVFSQVGHYTQVVWAKSIKIGCGYAFCSNLNRHLYACNYGPAGNSNINVPYTQGTKCASCPGNCVNNMCECNKICLNGGTLNLATCTCNCISGYSGADCALDCSSKTDPSYCINSYTAEKCPVYSNVPTECPHMCEFCPNAGIAVTGATDGSGTLVNFDPTGDGEAVTTTSTTDTSSTTITSTSSSSETTTIEYGTTPKPTTDATTTSSSTATTVSTKMSSSTTTSSSTATDSTTMSSSTTTCSSTTMTSSTTASNSTTTTDSTTPSGSTTTTDITSPSSSTATSGSASTTGITTSNSSTSNTEGVVSPTTASTSTSSMSSTEGDTSSTTISSVPTSERSIDEYNSGGTCLFNKSVMLNIFVISVIYVCL